MLFRGKQQLVIYAAAGLMAAGFVFFRYLPLHRRTQAIESQRVKIQTAIDKALAESKQLPVLKEQLMELQKTVGNYEKNIPTGRELGEFLHSVANLMNEHNLRDQVIAPGKEMELGDLSYIPVSMQCRGKLKDMFGFYKSLQGIDRLVRIEQVKFVNDRDFGGEVSMQTEAVIYYRPQGGQG